MCYFLLCKRNLVEYFVSLLDTGFVEVEWMNVEAKFVRESYRQRRAKQDLLLTKTEELMVRQPIESDSMVGLHLAQLGLLNKLNELSERNEKCMKGNVVVVFELVLEWFRVKIDLVN